MGQQNSQKVSRAMKGNFEETEIYYCLRSWHLGASHFPSDG
jgi:hypothetical protein